MVINKKNVEVVKRKYSAVSVILYSVVTIVIVALSFFAYLEFNSAKVVGKENTQLKQE